MRRPEQVFPRHLTIAIAEHDPRAERRALHAPPDPWQLVPRNVRMHVMRHVEIVVQEEQRPNAPSFHNVGSQVRMIVARDVPRTSGRESARCSDRPPATRKSRPVSRKRPPSTPSTAATAIACRSQSAAVTTIRARLAQLGAEERGDRDAGPTRMRPASVQLACKATRRDRAHVREMSWRQVERLGIVPYFRQTPARVPMVPDVRFTIDRVRHPQGQRQPADQRVDPLRASGMAMNRLVLKRAVPGEQDRSQRRREPQGQRVEVQAPQGVAAENRNGQAQRTQVETAGSSR